MNYFLTQLLGVAYAHTHRVRDLEEYRFRKLRRVLIEAQNCPYYREQFRMLGFDPRHDFKRIEDLCTIPKLDKQVVREYRDEFINPKYKNLVPCLTSGTTGEPLEVYTSNWQMVVEEATAYRALYEAGYRFGDAVASIHRSVLVDGRNPWAYDRRRNWVWFSVARIEENMDTYIDVMEKFGAKIVRGFPSALYIMAKTGKPFPLKIKAVISSSETLPEEWTPVLEDYFGAKVYNWYGQSERTVVAYQRRDGEMLWEENYGYVERVDGEIISTNLHNYAMPLIRYRTGDMAGSFFNSVIHAPSRGVSYIEGRKSDLICGVSGMNFNRMFYLIGATSWQLQETEDGVRVYVDGASEEKTLSVLRERLDVPITFTRTLITTKGGKRRSIVPMG